DFVSLYDKTELLSAANEVTEAIETEKVLLVKEATRFGLSEHFNDVDDILNASVPAINLEVTQDCNLRCGYCIYHDHFKGKRNYSRESMSFDVAKKAIDFLKEHSFKSESVSMGFYGGEPLMRFPFIRDCVGYAKEIFNGKSLSYHITTNGTLITANVADFLLSEGFSILVSLDGPEEIHNKYRKDVNGNGSFEKTLRVSKYWLKNTRNTRKERSPSMRFMLRPFPKRRSMRSIIL
ncbi:MAG: radical SAM protein, partial [bacterium]|nr:radical SAM protein [bacterium]